MAHSIEVGEADFEGQVLQASQRVPVVVDFWAPWCAPCRALKPILEKLALEYGGQFVLAKLNTDENPGISARYGIRGIPNVKGFRDGAVAAEFSGAVPEAAVRTFLQKLIPSASQRLRTAAAGAFQSGDLASAEEHLREALRLDPASSDVRLDLGELLIARGDWPGAETLLVAIPLREREARAGKLASQIEFWKKGQSLPSTEELMAKIERFPQDLAIRQMLAERLIADGAFEQALHHLMEMVQRDRAGHREAARKLMLEVFSFASDQPELVSRYRRLLASALN